MIDKGKKAILKGAIAAVITGTLASGTLVYLNNGNEKTGCIVKEYEALRDKKDMTIMIYMNGSSLESMDGEATKDINEIIENYPKEANLNIVVECGGTEIWDKEELAGEGNKRFLIDKNGIEVVETLEKRNMGETDTLSDFINYGMEAYPAERYMLDFWDHGGGSVKGFGEDENFGGDSLELGEIYDGIKNSKAEDKKIDIIGFDACLMNTVETCNILKDNAEYLVASQEVEPGEGWNYKWLLNLNNKDITDEKICECIVDEYIDYYKNGRCNLDISVIDLEKFKELEEIISDFFEKIPTHDKELLKEVSKLRTKGNSFGTGYGEKKTGDMLDLASLINNLNCVLKDKYYPIYDFNNCVIYKGVLGYEEEPSGLSIYLPVNSEETLVEDYHNYSNSHYDDKYIEFIGKYIEFLLEEEGYSFENLNPYLVDNVAKVSLNKEDINNLAAVYLATYKETSYGSGVYELLSTDSDVKIDVEGTVSSDVENSFTYINNELFSTIEKSFTKSELELYSPVLLNGDEAYLLIEYDFNNCNGTVLGAIRGFDPSEAQNKIINIKDGDEITPLFPFKDDSDISSISKDKIYNDEYFKGNMIKADEKGLDINDGELEGKEKIKYSFILINSSQEKYEININ